MVFCNTDEKGELFFLDDVTILILIDGFLQLPNEQTDTYNDYVTILILIDGFLQSLH